MHIVTHGGSKAHFDEVCAIALLLSEFGLTPVYRRDPTHDEIHDPEVFVVDVGKEYQPENRNFDHHGEDLPNRSSMILVANYINIKEQMLKAFEWVEFKDILDRKGPMQAAQEVGVHGNIRAVNSPLEGFMLSKFAEYRAVPEDLCHLLQQWGNMLIGRARSFDDKISTFIEKGRIERVAGHVVFWLPTEQGDNRVFNFLRKRLQEEEGVPLHMTVTRSSRDSNLSVYRFEDVDIDLSNTDNLPGIPFAHESGFLSIAKTEDDARQAIQQASK